MPDYLAKALNDPENKQLLSTFFGNLEDVKVKKKSKDYLKELEGFEQQRADYTNYLTMNQKLRDVSIGEDDYYNSSEVMNIQDEANPELQKTAAYQQFNNFVKTQQSLPPEQQSKMTFAEYVTQNPALRDELKNTGFITSNQSLKSKEEMKKLMFERAGFTPEQEQFYGQYQAINPTDFNRNLSDVLLRGSQDLKSKGRVGDDLVQMLGTKVKGLMVPEKDINPKYDITVDKENGTVIMVNPNDPTDVKTYPYSTGKPKKGDNDDIYKKIGYRITKKEDGNYVYEVPTDDGWKELPVQPSPEQVEQYNTDIHNKGLSYEEKKGIDYGFKVSTGNKKTSKKSAGPYTYNGKKIGDMTPDEIKQIPVDEIMKMDVGDLTSLNEKKGYLSSEQRKAIQDAKKNGSNSNVKVGQDSDQEKVPETMQKTVKNQPKNTSDAIKKASTIVNQTKLSKAISTFQSFIEDDKWAWEDDGGKHGNYNIPPEEWARELSYQPFYQELINSRDPELIGILEDWFKRKTGRNLEDF